MTFGEAYENACFSATADYLIKQEEKSREYQILDEESARIYKLIEEEVANKDLLDCYGSLENAKGSIYQKWTYQKALYDYTYLLKKVGFILQCSVEEDKNVVKIPISKELYELLAHVAVKREISIDFLANQSIKFAVEHPEKIMENL